MEAVPTSSGMKRSSASSTRTETGQKKKVKIDTSSRDLQYSPSAMVGNRIVWADPTDRDLRKSVTRVVIEEEEGKENMTYNFRVLDVTGLVELTIAARSFKLSEVQLPTTESSLNPHKAAVIVNHAAQLQPSGQLNKVQQRVRRHDDGNGGDSDDDAPETPEIPAAFSEKELYMVDYTYKNLCMDFGSAVYHKFTNAVGKMFFYQLGRFILLLQPTNRCAPFISTNPHGDWQPGSSVITHTSPAKVTRHGESDRQTTDVVVERVADFVIYDHRTKTYPVVGEVKSEDKDAESQNIEQMLGVWRENQCAMLGFTCSTQCIYPRILLKGDSTLILYCLPKLEFSNLRATLLHFTEYLIAFTSFVRTVE